MTNDFNFKLQQVMENEDARWELRAWLLLGVGALAIAGVFALMLALSRVPGSEKLVPWPLDFFHKGLVIHVVFSFVVWFLCMLSALAVAATYWLDDGRARGRSTGRSSVWMVSAAMILLLYPALKHASEASLNNYVPAILDPFYYLGLVFLMMGVLFVQIRMLASLARRANPAGPFGAGALWTAGAYLAAVACLVVTFKLGTSEAMSAELNERLFWGGGHVLQFVNVGLMMIGWLILAGRAGIDMPDRLFKGAMAALFGFALMGPLLYAIYPPFSAEQTQAFTDLQYLLAPVPVVLAAAVAPGLLAGIKGRPEAQILALSMAVFFLGGFLGLFVDGADTRTPAHYHGVIGGVNIAVMGAVFVFLLPLLGRGVEMSRRVLAIFWLYGAGQALHSLGLFFAGGYGAPRKVAGDVAGLEALGAKLSLYMMGIGAVIAVIGGVMFIWITGRALLRPAQTPSPDAPQ
ncbi:MAG: cbb3-type cytochrome c oxidase subunit I [Rhodospirillaceae bacterium]